MKKITAVLLAVCTLLLLAACGSGGGAQTYYATSEELSVNGTALDGGDFDPEQIYLIVDGDDMEFHYYGKTYTGHREKEGSQVIEWDEEPYILADAHLSFSSLLACLKNGQPDGYEFWFKFLYYGGGSLDGIDYKIRLR